MHFGTMEEESSIITNGKLVLAKPGERIPQPGDWIWTKFKYTDGLDCNDKFELVAVKTRDNDRFWLNHPIFNTHRYDKDLGKTWFWDKPNE